MKAGCEQLAEAVARLATAMRGGTTTLQHYLDALSKRNKRQKFLRRRQTRRKQRLTRLQRRRKRQIKPLKKQKIMNNQKSIVGCGYIPRKAQAMCLKTHTCTKLGEEVYKIIKDPYELVLGGIRLRPRRYMAVNVLDALTGLTYAVKYEPANLVRPTSEPQTDQPKEPVDFATRARQIAEELNALFTGGGNCRQVRGSILYSFGL